MTLKKSNKAIAKDIVFDDDDDDSSNEDIRAFGAMVKKSSVSGTKADEGDDDDSEESSSDSGSDSGDDDDVSSSSNSEAAPDPHLAKVGELRSRLAAFAGKTTMSSDGNHEDGSSEPDEEQVPPTSSRSICETVPSKRTSLEEEISAGPPPKKVKVKGKLADTEELASDEEREAIKAELSQMSIEEIQKLKEKLGLKLFNKALGSSPAGSSSSPGPSGQRKAFKRDNKNRPRELSSKKPITKWSKNQQASAVTSNLPKPREIRDPRFESACGEFNEKIFKESYKFVDEIKHKELGQLRQMLAECPEADAEEAGRIGYLVRRLENQLREKKRLEAKRSEVEEERTRNRKLVKEGQKPHFMGKRERENKLLVAKFEDLKKSGRLDKYIQKKNKQESTKERKKLETIQRLGS